MLSLDKYSVIQLQEFVMRAKEQGLCFKDGEPFGNGYTEINPVVEVLVLDVLRDVLEDLNFKEVTKGG